MYIQRKHEAPSMPPQNEQGDESLIWVIGVFLLALLGMLW